MLNTLRDSVKGWTAKILLGLLVLSFAVWGIGDAFQTGNATTVASAGDTEVSLQDYALAYSRASQRLAQQIGRQPTAEEAQMFGIDQGVIGQLVAGAVLDEQGRNLRLGLSEDQLARLIAEDSSFHDASGNFSRNAFRNILANAGMSEQDYIRTKADEAVRTQIIDAIAEGVDTPATFATALGLYNGERRTVEYVTLTPSIVPPVADPSDDVLATYFEENKANYAAPEYRSFAYALLTPEALSDPSTVTDEQIAADYETHRENYITPEQRRVQQIVFPDRAAADAAQAQLDAGSTFEAAAEQAGRSIVDLGMVARSAIPDQALADATFALAEGETSAVVDGRFGPVLLRVTEIQPEGARPMEEVSEEVRNELALVAANDAAAAAYNAFEDARAGGADFEEAARGAGITVVTVEAADRQGNDRTETPIADLPAEQELLTGVFDTEPGLDNVPINFGSNSYVFYDLLSITPAGDRSLDEVRDRVVADWKAAETQRLLAERIVALRAELDAGGDLDAIAAEVGVPKQTAQSISRQSGVAELGQAAVAAAFGGGNGTVATAPGSTPGTQLLLRVTEVAPPADPAANVAASERQQMATMLQDDLLQSYVTLLQNAYPVSINAAGIENAKAMLR
ncbi:peptidylprolyl isomerase [Aurantimonas aggregata]|uniref:Parvulin-like PPIase n=1 Tax=Aurantimonas aggregata TaxID=2047720 RepID=A0A6L9MJY2_9HYPH|nr:peptidylprolyl isomerase [Aurantimonas aggregata]NDV88143.1 peptidylprolyl isomerase [Aurantimonas aggregata]